MIPDELNIPNLSYDIFEGSDRGKDWYGEHFLGVSFTKRNFYREGDSY